MFKISNDKFMLKTINILFHIQGLSKSFKNIFISYFFQGVVQQKFAANFLTFFPTETLSLLLGWPMTAFSDTVLQKLLLSQAQYSF